MQMLADRVTICLDLYVSFPVYASHPGIFISNTDFHSGLMINFMVTLSLGPSR